MFADVTSLDSTTDPIKKLAIEMYQSKVYEDKWNVDPEFVRLIEEKLRDKLQEESIAYFESETKLAKSLIGSISIPSDAPTKEVQEEQLAQSRKELDRISRVIERLKNIPVN